MSDIPSSPDAFAMEPMYFDHVGLSVSDLAVSRQFYGDAFGFRTEEHSFELPAHDIKGLVLLNAQGVRIELFHRLGSTPGRIGHPTEGALTHGYFQFGLAVTNLSATFNRVVSAGAKPVLSPRIAPDGHTLFAFVADPDGNLLELLQRSDMKR
jgi:catechol 2,3-dioxygenase-like lactoylglutathione lyase family enzyme